jgi:hypothetical protein
VEGRLKSLCVAGDGAPITHQRIDRALAAVDGVEEYRLEQDAPGHARCAIVPAPGKSGQALRGTVDALSALFGAGVRIEVAEVPVLVPEKSGKFLLAHRSFPLDAAGFRTWEAAHG